MKLIPFCHRWDSGILLPCLSKNVLQESSIFLYILSVLQRKSDGEHESSRRLKTQFLIEMEGCGSGIDQLLLIGRVVVLFQNDPN